MRKCFISFLVIASMAMPMLAIANGNVPKFEDIRAQQAEIRSGVQAREGRYKDMSSNTRDELLTRQTRVLSTIDGKDGVNDLNQDQRTEVFNDLEWIEAAINKAEDEQLVCERVKTIGSNRVQRVCRTGAQIREDRERARQQMMRGSIQLDR